MIQLSAHRQLRIMWHAPHQAASKDAMHERTCILIVIPNCEYQREAWSWLPSAGDERKKSTQHLLCIVGRQAFYLEVEPPATSRFCFMQAPKAAMLLLRTQTHHQ